MVLIDFATLIDSIEEYAYLVLVIVAIYYLWLTIKGGADQGPKVWGMTKEAGGKIADLGKGIGRAVARTAKRDEAKTLREYYQEKEELKKIEPLPDKVNNTITILLQTRNDGGVTHNRWYAVRKYFSDLSDDIDKAIQEFRQVKKFTYRQQVETKRLINLMRKEKKITDADLTELTTMEGTILTEHKATEEKLRTAQLELEKVVRADAFKDLDKHFNSGGKELPTNHAFASGSTVGGHLEHMADELKAKVLPPVEDGLNHQNTAIENLDGFIAKFRKVWGK